MKNLLNAVRSGLKDNGNTPAIFFEEIDGAFVRFLEKRHPDLDESVLTAALLVSCSYRQGNVCLRLDEWAGETLTVDGEKGTEITVPGLSEWTGRLRSSPVVGLPGDYRPLILDDGNRLYLQRLFSSEQRLVEQLREKSSSPVPGVDTLRLADGLQRLFSAAGSDEQQMAAALGVMNRLTVISGGPGTGKTTTVVRLLALLLEQAAASGREISIALAAPTGKAAARLKESIRSSVGTLECPREIRDAVPEDAVTLHRLLGARRDGSFRHDRENPVPADVVIVDEASMIDQVMMSRLVDAMLPGSRLVLLGDRDQLASVEAGSVLDDICGRNRSRFSGGMIRRLGELGLTVPDEWREEEVHALTDNIVLLTRSYRFAGDSGIARFAGQVNRGEGEEALETLQSERWPDVGIRPFEEASQYHSELERWVADYIDRVEEGNTPASAFRAYRNGCILSAHRRGLTGVETLNRTMEQILQKQGRISPYREWYTGRPVMITRNDHSLNLHNGDIGICLPDGKGELRVWFQKEGEFRPLAPSRLSHYETAYAVTVHKSQGSEFGRILLMLPTGTSRILTRELIYTAATRARKQLQVRGAPEILSAGIRATIRRSSGLREYLW